MSFPMTTVKSLLTEIEAFCKEAEIAEATFSTRAVNDGKFAGRLRDGAGITVSTIARVEAYISQERAAMRKRRGVRAAQAPA